MKKTLLAALALTGLLSVSNSQAGPFSALTSYTQGDLLVGFQNASSTTNLIVNLGNIDNVFSNFNQFDIASDLRAAYGANWASSGLTWGVVAGWSDPDSGQNAAFATINSGNTEGWLNPNGDGPVSITANSSALGGVVNNIGLIGDVFRLGTKGTSGAFILKTTDDSWDKQVVNNALGSPLNYFGGDIWAGVNTSLDGYVLDGINNNFGTASFKNPEFTLSNTGVISVPEPSTYALCAFGVIALLMVCRRNRA